MKWKLGRADVQFLKNMDNYCKKMFFRNDALMTEEDESILYNCSKARLFTYTDDSQAHEFASLFNTRAFEWKQIIVNMYKVDTSKCVVKINDEEVNDEYFMVCQNDKVEIVGVNGNQFKGWNEKVYFDSPIAKHIIHEATF